MKIAVIAANGKAGSLIVKEAVERGNEVTAVVRGENKTVAQNVIKKDLFDLTKEDLAGFDAVVTAFAAWTTETFSQHTTSLQHLADILSGSDTRLLAVGGAGSLEVAPGKKLIDQPDFPEAYKAEASGGVIFLEQLKTASDLEWTFLSPSAMFVPGERTGKFRLGKDTLLSNENGSSISFEDYAIAFANELENPAHIRQRFTVGY